MISKQQSNTPCLPPTIIDRVPSIAPGSPPLTGASNISTPFFSHSAAIFCETSGAIELISITILPLEAPANTPFSPKITNSESAESGSIVMITSAASPTSLEEPTTVAPAAPNSSIPGLLLL
ncbi:MAG: Uncharacterised protein [Chloroflexota bacterium]|nr:MAG: Uncharacterised protein [Chloroflexota bacterium]